MEELRLRFGIDKMRLLFARYNRLLRFLVIILVIVLVVFFASSQFADINPEEFRQAIDELSLPRLAIVALLGLFAFFISGSYDLVENLFHPSGLSWMNLLWVGWTSQSFGRFMSSGGLSGGALRIKLYKRYHDAKEITIGYAARIWAAGLTGISFLIWLGMPFALGRFDPLVLLLSGLFSLYLPFYYLTGFIKIGRFSIKESPIGMMPLVEKASLHLISTVEWLAAFFFFVFCLKLFSPLISLPVLLFVFAASTALGYLSFIPSGLGSFDLAAISMLESSGLIAERIVLSLLLYRIFFFFVPFIIFMLAFGLNSSYRYFRCKKQKTS